MNLKAIFQRFFGYSRGERVGSFILVGVIVTVIVSRLINLGPDNKISISNEYISELEQGDSIKTVGLEQGFDTGHARFIFDPNTVSLDEMIKLGFTERQANTLLSYRNTGARFKRAEDILKIYGLTKELADSLIPYIEIDIEYHSPHRASFEESTPAFTENESVKPEMEGAVSVVRRLLIDINSADSLELQKLRGIGPVLGARIVKYRNILGGFVSLNQLSEVYGIDSTLSSELGNFLTLDTTLHRRININKADYGELIRHPYINSALCSDLLDYRDSRGKILTMNELIVNKILDKPELELIRPYIILSDSTLIQR